MYDNILHIFHSDARSIGYLNFDPSPINFLVTIHEKLVFEFNHHVPLENDPEWLWLDHVMSMCAWFWIFWIVRRVHNVYGTVLPS